MGLHSDRSVLLQEFSSNPRLTEFAHSDLEKYQAIVQEKDHNSKTYVFKIPNDSENDEDSCFEDCDKTMSHTRLDTQYVENSDGLTETMLQEFPVHENGSTSEVVS